MTLHLRNVETPVGRLVAAVDEADTLRRLAFAPGGVEAAARAIARAEREEAVWEPTAAERLVLQLSEYFAGHRRRFDMAIDPRGAVFDRRAWEALCAIPYGETRSYGKLASELGAPGGARAVGRAAAINPIAIVVPCHRVVGADGALTGYGGGLDVKRRLLELEGALPPSLL